MIYFRTYINVIIIKKIDFLTNIDLLTTNKVGTRLSTHQIIKQANKAPTRLSNRLPTTTFSDLG